MPRNMGAAKDPVNMAGMVAANALRGDTPLAQWEDIQNTKALILDVRTKSEYEDSHIEGAIHIPIDGLRSESTNYRKVEKHGRTVPPVRGLYYAVRLLLQNKFKAKNLTGGFQTYISLKELDGFVQTPSCFDLEKFQAVELAAKTWRQMASLLSWRCITRINQASD